MNWRRATFWLLVTGWLLAVPASAGRSSMSPPGPEARSAHIQAMVLEAQEQSTASGKSATPSYYIVQLAEEPLAGYLATTVDQAPQRPLSAPRNLDVDSSLARAYLDLLTVRQERFLRAATAALGHRLDVLHRYRYALNGVAIWLSPAEAEAVQRLPGVRRVERNQSLPLATDIGPRWIGAGRVWDGTAMNGMPATKGEGIVVGVIDTGINSDHPSFAAVGADGYVHQNPLGAGNYTGFCDAANLHYDAGLACNDKLIGIWSFEESLNDPEDRDGHGSHTASTAAGNVTEAMFVAGGQAFVRTISGVAPHANIIAYDVCIPANPIWRCMATATVQAVDHAIAEGVDVLNYSIGTGQNSPWENMIAEAFLNARKANVMVVSAAGNDGPEPSSVHSTAPWVLTVGATSHSRAGLNLLTGLKGGSVRPPADLPGYSYSRGAGPAPIVYAGTLTNASGQRDDGTCMSRFPADSLKGKIVVCDSNGDHSPARQDYIAGSLRSAGAIGLVRVNRETEGDRVNAGLGFRMPALNLSYANGKLLKDWLARGTGHQGTIRGAQIGEEPAFADVLADFSARGPAPGEDCCYRPDWELHVGYLFDVLKPEVLAPGVDILAAVATDEVMPAGSPEFGVYGGTSMASPHGAGAAALLRAVHPDWTPAEIQSALTLTATGDQVRLQDGTTRADALAAGAGRLDVGRAAASGIVLAVPNEAYDEANPVRGGDPRELNLATLTDHRCAGWCSWSRTLSTRLPSATSWQVSTNVQAGLSLVVEPKIISVAPDRPIKISVRADVTRVPVGQWAFGQVILTPEDGSLGSLRMPVTVRSVGLRGPLIAVVSARDRTGSAAVVGFRSKGGEPLRVAVSGLTKASQQGMSLTVDPTPDNPYDLLAGTRPFTGTMEGTMTIRVDVPAGARRLVAEVVSSEAPDIDLFVGYDADRDGQAEAREQAALSGSPSWTEYCDVTNPRSGPWWIHVQSWQGSEDQPDDVVVAYAVVPATGTDEVRAQVPERVAPGEAYDVGLSWQFDAVERGDRHFGQLELTGGQGGAERLGVVPLDVLGPPLMTPPPAQTATPTPTPTPFVWPTDPPPGPRVSWLFLPAVWLQHSTE